MDAATLLLLAVGLSMDAFAVSISNAMGYAGLSKKQMLATSASFGLFQGIMPTIGFFGGTLLAGVIQGFDHWVALVLLGFIGGKMLVEGIWAIRKPEDAPEAARYTVKTMMVQSLATSIDALAVGVSFAALSVNIWLSVLVIACITFAISLIGGILGRRFGALLGDWAQILGGVILVGIGLRIFVEHMWF